MPLSGHFIAIDRQGLFCYICFMPVGSRFSGFLVYRKALPQIDSSATAPFLYIHSRKRLFRAFYAVFAHNPPPGRPFSVFLRISI